MNSDPLPRGIARLVAMLWIATAIGCTETIEVDFPEEPPQLVVYSLFHPDSVWEVSVSSTKDLNSPNTPYSVINEATVEIYQGAQRVDELTFQGYLTPGKVIDNVRGVSYDTVFWRRENQYRSERGLKPEPGVMYTVYVSAPGYPSVEATSSVPDSPSATLEAFSTKGNTDDFYDRTLEITSVIRDAPGQNDFYLAGASYPILELQARPDGTYDTTYRRQFASLETVDVQSTRLQEFKLFSDQSFYGITYPITFSLLLDEQFVVTNPDSLTLYVGSVSEPFYRYYEALEAQGEYGVDFINLTDPPKAYSNVDGGLGVFAGYNTTDFRIDRRAFE